MKFSCEKCNTSYVIADEKIGRGLKVRCKKCGNIILIRGRSATAASTQTSEDEVTERVVQPSAADSGIKTGQSPGKGAGAASGGGGDLLQGLSFDDEKTVQYDPSELLGKQAAGGGEPGREELQSELTEEETRVFDVERLKELMEEREIAAAEKKVRPAAGMPGFAVQPPKPASEPVWYLAIGGRQVGPLPVDDVKEKMRKGEVDLATYVWRGGFKDWTHVSAVPELERIYREVAPRKAAAEEKAAVAVMPGTRVKVSERRPLTTGRMYGGALADENIEEPFQEKEPEQEKEPAEELEVKIGSRAGEHKPAAARKRKATVVEFDLSELASLAKKEVEEEPEEKEEEEVAKDVARSLAVGDAFSEEAVRVESKSSGNAEGAPARAETGRESSQEAGAESKSRPSVKDLLEEELAAAEEEGKAEAVPVARAEVSTPGALQERVPEEARAEDAYTRRDSGIYSARKPLEPDKKALIKVAAISFVAAIFLFGVLVPFGLVVGFKMKVPLYYDWVYGGEQAQRFAKPTGVKAGKNEKGETARSNQGKSAGETSKAKASPSTAGEQEQAVKKQDQGQAQAKGTEEKKEKQKQNEPEEKVEKKQAKKSGSAKQVTAKTAKRSRRVKPKSRRNRREVSYRSRSARKQDSRRSRDRKTSRSQEKGTTAKAAASPADEGDFDDILDDTPSVPIGSKTKERKGFRRRSSRGRKARAAVEPDFGEDEEDLKPIKRRKKVEEPLPPMPKRKKGEVLPDTLDKKTILNGVKRGMRKIQRCAEEQISRDKSAVVRKISLSFTIQRSGRCTNVIVGPSKLKGSYFESCVKRTVRSWRYPKFFGENIKVKMNLPIKVH